MNHPEATAQALAILRNGQNFQWYVIPILAVVMYIYLNEASKKNWRGIAAGLALYMVHWFAEILNALIQHLSGHALWTVPTGTSFLLLIGVGVELSLMFSAAGLILSKPLPDDPKMKVFGINNRVLFVVFNAAPEMGCFVHPLLKQFGFELHPLQVDSEDPVVRGAAFDQDAGSVCVPARTAAVFVEPQ